MTLPRPIRFDLDLSGVRASNLVTGERHNVSPTKRYFALDYGPFYREGFRLFDVATGNRLDESTDGEDGDYIIGHAYEDAQIRSSQEVGCTVYMLNTTVSQVSVNAQMVGGPYTYAVPIIEALLEALSNDDRPIRFGDLVGLPEGFPPAHHLHAIFTMGGWTDVISRLEGIRQAILAGDSGAHQELLEMIEAVMAMFKWATTESALAGLASDEIISPATLAAVLAEYAGNAQVVLPDEDFPWGYYLDPKSRIMLAFGSGGWMPPSTTNGWFCAFKKRFLFKPIIVNATLTKTTDSVSNIVNQIEMSLAIPEHLVTKDGVYAIPFRESGSGNDWAKLSYLAIGKSTPEQPEATTPGFEANIPPTDDVLRQPVWSGAQAITVVVQETGSHRVGVLFAGAKQGGGYLINANNQAANGDFFYTPYPQLFVDADYEVQCVQTSTTGTPNFSVLGQALGQWIPLSTMKALGASNPMAGFVFNVTGQNSGSITYTVQIRHKTTLQTASRTFTLTQSSSVVAPYFGSWPQDSAIYTFNTANGDANKMFDVWINGNEQLMARYSGSDGQLGAPFVLASFSPPGNAGYINARLSQYEVKFHGYNAAGMAAQGYSTSGVNHDLWHSMDLLVANATYSRVTMTPNKTFNAFQQSFNGGGIRIRHKTDITKEDAFYVYLNKVGDSYAPIWAGSTSLTENETPSSSTGTYTFTLRMDYPAPGQGMLIMYLAGSQVGSTTFQYSVGVGSWSSGEYNVTIDNLQNVSDLTASGSSQGESILAAQTYNWQGNFSSASLAKTMSGRITLRHRATGDSSNTSFNFTLNKTAYSDPRSASISGGQEVYGLYVNSASTGVSHSVQFNGDRSYTFVGNGTSGSTATTNGTWLNTNYTPSDYEARVGDTGSWTNLPGSVSWVGPAVGSGTSQAVTQEYVTIRNKTTGATTTARFTSNAIPPYGQALLTGFGAFPTDAHSGGSWNWSLSFNSDGSATSTYSTVNNSEGSFTATGRWLPPGFPSSNWDIRQTSASSSQASGTTGFTGVNAGASGKSNGSFSFSASGSAGTNAGANGTLLGSQLVTLEFTNKAANQVQWQPTINLTIRKNG